METIERATEPQIYLVADYIIRRIPGEPSENEGAGETACRLLEMYRVALQAIMNELGEPTSDYPSPVANAHQIAKDALGSQD